MGSAQLKYEIAPWINISGRAKIDKNFETHEKKFSASTLELLARDSKYGSYAKRDLDNTQIYAEALLNINKYFCDDQLSLTATLGTNMEYTNFNDQSIEGGLKKVANVFSIANIDKNHQQTYIDASGYKIMKQAVFANVQLGWKGMVYLDVTARNDWTSTFAKSNYKSFFYPTVGLSGIFTEIFPGLKGNVLSYLKARVSYSEVGNDPEPFLTIPTYAITMGNVNIATRRPNADLQPERTKSWEVGLNTYWFNNRLKIDATYYHSRTYNQFFENTLSTATGYSSEIINAGQVNNQGIELAASWDQTFANGFNWRTYMTYSHNENKIVSLPLEKLELGGMAGMKTVLKEGGSMGDIYVTSLKVDEHGAIYVHPSNQTVTADYNTYVYAGDTAPKHLLSWGNEFSFKGFNLGFLFIFLGDLIYHLVKLSSLGNRVRITITRLGSGSKTDSRLEKSGKLIIVIGFGIGDFVIIEHSDIIINRRDLGYNFGRGVADRLTLNDGLFCPGRSYGHGLFCLGRSYGHGLFHLELGNLAATDHSAHNVTPLGYIFS
jgi:outer membrane receptor protein involved in Fe transport